MNEIEDEKQVDGWIDGNIPDIYKQDIPCMDVWTDRWIYIVWLGCGMGRETIIKTYIIYIYKKM